MAAPHKFRVRFALVVALAISVSGGVWADDADDWKGQVRQLQQQNQQLQQQLQQQQHVIDSLSRKMDALETSRESVGTEPAKPLALGKIILSGEAGVAFFETEHDGQFPHSEFRVDEAKLFLDAQVFHDVYFFAEINLASHESSDLFLNVGELYLDFENVSRLWNADGAFNLRIGRFDTPFGEEYIERDAIDDPLIMHSLADIWGEDEGVEAYGRLGKFQYVLAVQNGGIPSSQDFTSDKAIIARLGFDPTHWLHLSASAMRTGDLDAEKDSVSALWFGNGFFRAIGAPATTTLFHADLVEGDIALRWSRGHLKAFGGYVNFDDNDTAVDNHRDVYYYSVEALQHLTEKLYGVARFSQIIADGGFPIVANSDFDEYFFDELTKKIERLSLGLGYRWSRDLVLKVEYTMDWGRTVSGGSRDHEDQFALQLAGRF